MKRPKERIYLPADEYISCRLARSFPLLFPCRYRRWKQEEGLWNSSLAGIDRSCRLEHVPNRPSQWFSNLSGATTRNIKRLRGRTIGTGTLGFHEFNYFVSCGNLSSCNVETLMGSMERFIRNSSNQIPSAFYVDSLSFKGNRSHRRSHFSGLTRF